MSIALNRIASNRIASHRVPPHRITEDRITEHRIGQPTSSAGPRLLLRELHGHWPFSRPERASADLRAGVYPRHESTPLTALINGARPLR